MRKSNFIVAFVCLFGWWSIAEAQYVLVLKNGRQITVQSYREEGSMIKFSGLGGEVAISKDQVQTIQRGSAGLKPTVSSPPSSPPAPSREGPQRSNSLESEKKLVEDRKIEEESYRTKLKEIEDRIKTVRDQYAAASGGTANPEGSNLSESLKAWTTDLTSRLKEAEKAPIVVYSLREKELKELRDTNAVLEEEKSKLLQQMREANIDPPPAQSSLKR